MPPDAVGHRDLRRGAVAVGLHVVGDVADALDRAAARVRPAARRSSWRWTPVAVASSAAGSSASSARARAASSLLIARRVVGRLRGVAESPCAARGRIRRGLRPAAAAAAAREGERARPARRRGGPCRPRFSPDPAALQTERAEERRAGQRGVAPGQPAQHARPHVGERAVVAPAAVARERREQRHVLARVIGARRRRVAAVVGGDHQQVALRVQPLEPARHGRVDRLQRRRGSPDVLAVAVDLVGLDEVRRTRSRRRARPSAASSPRSRPGCPRPGCSWSTPTWLNTEPILPTVWTGTPSARSSSR